MTLTCPNCGNDKSFTTIGQPGMMKCSKDNCNCVFPIEGNYT